MTNISKGIIAYLRVPFVIIVWMMETFTKNRSRFKEYLARPHVSLAFKIMLAITALAWIVIAIIASEDSGTRLSDAVKGLWSEAQDISEQRKKIHE